MKVKKEIDPNKKKLINRIFTIVECLIIVLCVVISIVVIVNNNKIKKDGGNLKMLTVQSDSMDPTIPVGSLIRTKKPGQEVLDLGTIVTFKVYQSNGIYLDTHRIVAYRYKDSSGSFGITYYVKGEMESSADFYEKYPQSSGYEIVSYVTRGDKYTILYGDENDYSKSKAGAEADVTSFNDSIYQEHSSILAVYKGHVKGLGSVIDWLRQPLHIFFVIIIPLILLFIYNVYGMVKLFVAAKVNKVKEENQLSEEEIKRRAIEEYLASQALQNGGQVTETPQTAEAAEPITELKNSELNESNVDLPQEQASEKQGEAGAESATEEPEEK